MPHVTASPSVSLDGYMAGHDQSLENPLGVGGRQLHAWFSTEPELTEETDDDVTGAVIMGRNMFGPVRGEWDVDWNGWWGEDPPWHAPVFVLTHYERASVEMRGGTTFHFVTGGPEEALRLATEAAGDKPIRVAGGASTTNQFLRARRIDELELHVVPIMLGSGESLFADLKGLSFEIASSRSTPHVTHLTLRPER